MLTSTKFELWEIHGHDARIIRMVNGNRQRKARMKGLSQKFCSAENFVLLKILFWDHFPEPFFLKK